MPPTAAIALKEWAAVCEALAAGRQTILLRKGGIAERPGGFRPEHAEFWLLPTYFHATPEALKPEDRRFFDQASATPPADRLRIELFARVTDVLHLDREESLARIAEEHVYGEQTVRERFHYRRPGLWLLAVQVFRCQRAEELPVWPELAGCHSWVELPRALPTDGLTSVLDGPALAGQHARLREILTAGAPAVASPAVGSPVVVPSGESAPQVDMAAILERLQGDEGLLERLISIYRQDRFPWMSRALEALVQQDMPALIFSAHRLHGLLCHFAGAPAAQTAGRLEQLARQADVGAAQTAYGQLEGELTALDTALDAWQRRG